MNYLQNIKTWCRNNLVPVGKWGGASFLFGVTITAFLFGGNHVVRAFVSKTVSTSSDQKSEFKLDLNPMDKINDISTPADNLIKEIIKGFRINPSINIGTEAPSSPIKNSSQDIDFNRFFSSSTVSSNDITSFLKEAVITGINLTILVISITTQVLKGILGAIK